MLIRNASALIARDLCPNTDIRFENGKITMIGKDLAPLAGENVLEAEGKILSPGFVDIHIHGYGGKDTMNGKDHIAFMAKGLVKHGVTGFLPTTMADDYEKTREALKGAFELMNDEPVGTRVLGCHLEGPFLNVAKKGAQPAQYIYPGTMENYLRIAKDYESAVKLMTIAPEPFDNMALISALGGKFALSAGHTDATVDEMDKAAAAGISQVTHLFNGMNPLNHRNPGVPGAALTDERIGVQIIADLLHLHRDILKLAWRAKGADLCYLITDAMEATGMPDGEYMLGANHVTVKNREARLADGTIAGSTLTLDLAIRNMHKVVGVPLAQALYMASTAPANSIGENERGRLEIGAHADLTLLDADLEVEMTIVGGEIAYKRA